MRTGVLTGVALLAAGCSQAEPADGQADATDAAPAPATHRDPATADTADAYLGTFDLAYADGTQARVTFLTGGLVSAEFAGQAVTASYTVPEPGKVCFDNVSTGDPPHCWVNSPADAQGAWVATMDDGSTLTVTPAG
ncbi:MAG: hypothetical protein KDE15_10440 [Erythrobacter sp.]|nr:hypothetical protein [Erythrobacter sp.]